MWLMIDGLLYFLLLSSFSPCYKHNLTFLEKGYDLILIIIYLQKERNVIACPNDSIKWFKTKKKKKE